MAKDEMNAALDKDERNDVLNKDGVNAALDKMLEQGNQLRASELIPVLKAIVEALPSE